MSVLLSRIVRAHQAFVEVPQGWERRHVDAAARWLVYLDPVWSERFRSVAGTFSADLYHREKRRPLPSQKETLERYLIRLYEWRSEAPCSENATIQARNEILGEVSRSHGLEVFDLVDEDAVVAWVVGVEQAASVADVILVLGYAVDAVDDFVADYCAVQDMLTHRKWTRSGYSESVDECLDLLILDAAAMTAPYGPNAWPVLVEFARSWRATTWNNYMRSFGHE